MAIADIVARRGARNQAARAESRRTTVVTLGSSPLARGATLALLLVFCLLWLVPLAWGILTSLKSETDAGATPLQILPEHGLTLDAYREVLGASALPLWLVNSLGTAIAVTVLTLVNSALAAYALSRLEFRGRRWLEVATMVSLLVPGQILLVPLFQEMLALGLVDTYWGIVIPQILVPVNVIILKRFFDAIPKELEEAAYIDGASRLLVLWRIVLPLSRSILVAVGIFTFITTWNNFLWPFIVVNDPALMTMPVGLPTVKSAYGVQYAQTMAGAVIAAAPLLVIFLFFQRQIVKGIATTGLGGQ